MNSVFTFIIWITCSRIEGSFTENDSVLQMASLESLYSTTNGTSWNWLENTEAFGFRWNFSKSSSGQYADNCCNNWQGICCHSELSSLKCRALSINSTAIPANNNSSYIVAILLIDLGIDGTLPPSLFNISTVEYIDIAFNPKLVGTIPPAISQAKNLTYLSINDNNVDGTIPTSLALLSKLTYLGLYHNELEGSMPPLFGLSNLEGLYLYHNHLTGRIIDDLAISTPLLSNLYLDYNYLEGNIPALAGLMHLTDVYVNHNVLEGTVPDLTGLFMLRSLYLEYNCLTGDLPVLDGMMRLANLFLNNNNFVGTISLSTSLVSLSYLYLNNNLLDGSLPSSLGGLFNLTFLNLQSNYITGKLVSQMGQLPKLSSLLLHGNSFSGSPLGCLSSSLATLDISDNNFSGTIPGEVFVFPNISHVSMVKNCFSGSLPYSLCSAGDTLESLALDGLTSGNKCLTSLFWGITHTYDVQRFVHGTIPLCLFQMSRLRSLELSGNGLTGQLPGGQPTSNGNGLSTISASLRNLSVSHNRLSGTIPALLQQHDFDWLDLSFNKLSGALDDLQYFFLEKSTFSISYDFNSTSAKKILSLEVNRLSGMIPSAFQNVENIDMVTGNLFDCVSSSDLPVHDPGSPQAQCGSFDLNVGLILWTILVLVTIIIAGMALMAYFNLFTLNNNTFCCSAALNRVYIAEICQWRSQATDSMKQDCWHTTGTALFFHLLDNVWKYVLLVLTAAVVLLLPAELILKTVHTHTFSTHMFQYAYTPSMAFVSSEVPAVVFMVAVIGLMTILFMISTSGFKKEDLTVHNNSSHDNNYRETFHEIALWLLVILVDAVVLIAVNGLYLTIALYQKQEYANLAVIALVIFKIFWNARIVPMAVNQIVDRVQHGNISPGVMMTALMLFNNILVPILATLCSQPECFYNIFVPAASLSANVEYSLPQGATFSDGQSFLLDIPHFEIITFQPPFIYSYQCSSALITYYVPMYVIMYIYLGFLSPVLCVVVMYFHTKSTRALCFQSSSAKLMNFVLSSLGCEIMQSRECLMNSYSDNFMDINKSYSTTVRPAASSVKLLLNGRDIGAGMICHLATMLTFGLAYPLLSVLISWSVAVQTLQWTMLVGRYLVMCKAAVACDGSEPAMMNRLESSCAGVGDMLHQSRWLLLVAMSLFFSLFLLDMAGDRARDNWRDILWAPMTVLLWPVLLLLLHVSWSQAPQRSNKLIEISMPERPSLGLREYSTAGVSDLQTSLVANSHS